MESRDFVPGLAESLKNKRNMIGISQSAAAKLADISRPNLIGYESGKRTPSLAVLLRIAAAYDCTVADLLPPAGGSPHNDQAQLETSESDSGVKSKKNSAGSKRKAAR